MISTTHPRFLVDFNRLSPDRRIRTRLQRAQGPIWGSLAAGELIELVDADGEECLATITEVEGDIISCQVHLETWRDSPRTLELGAGGPIGGMPQTSPAALIGR